MATTSTTTMKTPDPSSGQQKLPPSSRRASGPAPPSIIGYRHDALHQIYNGFVPLIVIAGMFLSRSSLLNPSIS